MGSAASSSSATPHLQHLGSKRNKPLRNIAPFSIPHRFTSASSAKVPHSRRHARHIHQHSTWQLEHPPIFYIYSAIIASIDQALRPTIVTSSATCACPAPLLAGEPLLELPRGDVPAVLLGEVARHPHVRKSNVSQVPFLTQVNLRAMADPFIADGRVKGPRSVVRL